MTHRACLLVSVLILASGQAAAMCTDAASVAAARAVVAGACDCVTASNRRTYVQCARAAIGGELSAGRISRDCARVARRCASSSTCGRPGAVTCCRTSARGTTRCRIKSGAADCQPTRGGTACVGVFASCCDACASGGCVTPTTTTSSTSTSTTSTTSTTVARISCGPVTFMLGFPMCGGAATCPAGMFCSFESGPAGVDCFCMPNGVVPCLGGGTYCSDPTNVCQHVIAYDGPGFLLFDGNMCVRADTPCNASLCTVGTCPSGACTIDASGLGFCGCGP